MRGGSTRPDIATVVGDAGLEASPAPDRPVVPARRLERSDQDGAPVLTEPAGKPAGFRHIPALDGLRGAAVAGVLLFHGGKLTGGYMGVDLFFVLSGFLITTLLLREFDGSGTVRLGSFWARRARRLLPALFGVMAGVALYTVLFAKSFELPGIRADSLSTLFYVANWHSIFAGSGYWDQYAAPSPLEHTWSLAIEEQFYLVWPLVVLGLLKLTRGSKAAVLVTALVGALVSSIVMALLWVPDVDPSRVYLGTDTRAAAVLLGAALATLMAWRGPVHGAAARRALEFAAWAAAAALLVVWVTVEGTSPFLYRYGFLLCGLACTVVIAAAAHPRPGPLTAALSWRPLRSLGLISYGLYLWHWPVFIALEAHAGPWGLDRGIGPIDLLFVLQVGVSLAFAVVSYVVLEKPIRYRGLAAWKRPVLVPVAAMVSVSLVLWATAGGVERPGLDGTSLTSSADGESGGLGRPELPELAPEAVGPPPSGAAAGAAATTVPAPPGGGEPQAATGPIARPAGRSARLMVVGDSVASYLEKSLDQQKAALRLSVAKQAMVACPLVNPGNESRDDGKADIPRSECYQWRQYWSEAVSRFRPDAVLVAFGGPPKGERHIGDGWYPPCSPEHRSWLRGQYDQAIAVLSKYGATVYLVPMAYVTNVWFPRSLDAQVDCNNQVLRQAAAGHAEARVVDLDRYVCPEPTGDSCRSDIDGVELREDGMHYQGSGADLIARWLTGQVFTPP